MNNVLTFNTASLFKSLSLISLLLPAPATLAFDVRSLDGSCNHANACHLGQAKTPLARIAPADYDDGQSTPSGSQRPSPREISNALCTQHEPLINSKKASGFLWLWGQFLDHDIDLSLTNAHESFPIPVPAGDEYFDPNNTGQKTIPFERSASVVLSNPQGVREQINSITSYIDASNVYGSDTERALALRTLKKGKLKTTQGGQYLPINKDNLDNAGEGKHLFLAGDVRANEQISLLAIHTLFVREHNRLCDELNDKFPEDNDEAIYQKVRKMVGAFMQVITYNEFLPVLLGQTGIAPYSGYDENIDPSIFNEFSTAAYRLGHSLVNSHLIRINPGKKKTLTTSLKDAYFYPKLIYRAGGLDSLLLGMGHQHASELDIQIVDELRNFLFNEPSQGGLDLAALNIQRGRDHGLADYNSVRVALGLPKKTSFAQITSNPDLQSKLSTLYTSVDDIDLWVGGLLEAHASGSMVGETFRTILIKQFTNLRDGDRFWYENDAFFNLYPDLKDQVENITLAKIIKRNTKHTKNLQDNAFIYEE